MMIMKRIKSWSIIIGITVTACAALGAAYVFGWWNVVCIACMILLVYAMISER